MSQFARLQYTSNQCKEIDLSRPFSNFNFVDHNFGGLHSLRRIMSQVRVLGGTRMVVEELCVDASEDLQSEQRDLQRCSNKEVASIVSRLGFFKSHDPGGYSQEDFLGYAIVKKDAVNRGLPRIYESVLRPSRHDNNFVRNPPRWKCVVNGATYSIDGYLYCQQNGITNCCAHVAVRSAAAQYHPDGDMLYHEMNEVLGIDQGRSLDQFQMAQLLEHAGARVIDADYSDPTNPKPPAPFQKYIYGSIESGYPAIVCFGTLADEGHAIPVFGHTLNEDTWVPSAEQGYFKIGEDTTYIPSESWLSAFIAHDDNWGSNFCIPRNYLFTREHCEFAASEKGTERGACALQSDCVLHVLATLPSDVLVNPIQAEAIGLDYLRGILAVFPAPDSEWQARLRFYADRNLLVFRPLLIAVEEYLHHLEGVRDWNLQKLLQEDRSVLREILKDIGEKKLWMIELSVPELFSANRRKIAEVLLDAELAPSLGRDLENFLLARVPGYFAVFRDFEDNGAPRFLFAKNNLSHHVPLFGCPEDSKMS